MNTLLLIDAFAIIHRAYHALPPLRTKQGIPTNAIYGFFGMINKAIQDFEPNHIVVCFDTAKKTFRQELFVEYQSHRPALPDDFGPQVEYIREFLDVGGVARLEKEGYEADDIIGTLAQQFKKDMRVLILTGDKDIMQLVDTNVYVISPQTGLSSIVLYDKHEVMKKLGVSPEKIPEYKGLVGDPSDNYPGARGIGPKTAIKLIEEFGTVENILLKTDSIQNERTKHLIKENKENIITSRKLAQIVTDVPVDITEAQTEFHGFNQKLKNRLQELEMKSLITKLFENQKEIKKVEKIPPPKKEKQEDPKDQIDLFN